MKKVLLKYYDKTNLGDDLFIKIITERYQNSFSVILSQKNVFFNTLKQVKTYHHPQLFLLYKLAEKIARVRHLWLARLAKKHDILLSIGGSIFIERNNLAQWRREQRFYNDLSIPYYILGSNFGPHQTPDFVNVIASILKKAKDVCFRDRTSYATFSKLSSTRVATDIAFSLNTAKIQIKEEKLAVFSVIDCHRRFGKEIAERYERMIVALSSKLLAEGYEVHYMSFCQFEGDETAIQNIKHQLPSADANQVKVFYYHGQLNEALALIARSKVIVATRFHAIILGLLFGKKILPIAYDKKTSNMLADLNYQGEVVSIHQLDQFDLKQFSFEQLSVHAINDQIKLAEKQFEKLDKILIQSSPKTNKKIADSKTQFEQCVMAE